MKSSGWSPILSRVALLAVVLASSCSKSPTKPVPAAGEVTPRPLDFGSVTMGSPKDLGFTIKNKGGGTLSGTVGAGSGAFSVVSGSGSYSLTAGQEKQVTVRFAPTLAVAGAQQCTLLLGSQVCADLACTGMAASPMALVPAGDFTMGRTYFIDAWPVHTVHLDAFYIDKYEVTNAQFKLFVDAGGYSNQTYWSAEGWSERTSNGWTQPVSWSTGEDHSGPAWPVFPVVGVSWYEAEAYANFAGKRLPTEAEWEKAARGTDERLFPWGNNVDGSRANYHASGDPYDDGSTPVDFYDGRLYANPTFQTTDSPSPYGAYDMAGNVWEWVKDWYQADYYSVSPAANPPGPSSGSARSARSGSWGVTNTDYLQSAHRSFGSPSNRNGLLGFRCARSVP
jgi:formylglycine-generating enzyme required for sulfatase activity